VTCLADRMAFTVDETYDRDYGSGGRSRFGAYLRLNAGLFRDGGEMTIESRRFALSAWQIAQSPIMAPGYVLRHARVLGTEEHWDDEGRAALTVHVATPLPASVEWAITGWRWRGWEHVGYSDPRWVQPYDNDRPAAFTVVALRIPLPAAALPTPRYRDGIAAVATAKRAVGAVRDVLNRELCPVLAALGA
jgi:hypothetical protein